MLAQMRMATAMLGLLASASATGQSAYPTEPGTCWWKFTSGTPTCPLDPAFTSDPVIYYKDTYGMQYLNAAADSTACSARAWALANWCGLEESTVQMIFIPALAAAPSPPLLPPLTCPDVCTGNPMETCFYDPTCSRGGLGCNAGGQGQECRFCGFGDFPECPPNTGGDPIPTLGCSFEEADQAGYCTNYLSLSEGYNPSGVTRPQECMEACLGEYPTSRGFYMAPDWNETCVCTQPGEACELEYASYYTYYTYHFPDSYYATYTYFITPSSAYSIDCPLPPPSPPSAPGVRFEGPAPAADETTDVLVLGAGMSGISAANSLRMAGIDFIILEGNDRIGGRARTAEVGGYTIEAGANWIMPRDGLVEGGVDNPMWQLAEELGSESGTAFVGAPQQWEEMLAFDANGAPNNLKYAERRAEMDRVIDTGWMTQVDNEKRRRGGAAVADLSLRSLYREAGWTPVTPLDHALDWREVDYGWAADAEATSSGVVDYSYIAWGDPEWWVADPRGFVALAEELGKQFIGAGCGSAVDPASDTCSGQNLRLGERVVSVTRPEGGGVLVGVRRADGSTKTYGARYAICSFSVGVLQRSVGTFNGEPDVVAFEPALPEWKRNVISRFGAGYYVKFFLKFDHTFWDDTELFLYAAAQPGRWPVWQNLNRAPGFEGSHILMATCTGALAQLAAQLSDAEATADAMGVLRQIYPGAPEPSATFLSRWPTDEWAYLSYPFFPVNTMTWESRALEFPVGQLFFTGDATEARYPSYTHGAYLAGQHTAALVLACLGHSAAWPRNPVEAAWLAQGVDCPAMDYDAEAVERAYHQEPVPGPTYYYYYGDNALYPYGPYYG